MQYDPFQPFSSLPFCFSEGLQAEGKYYTRRTAMKSQRFDKPREADKELPELIPGDKV